MKPRLQVSLGQHLAMTPQLQQAIRLLQLSSTELDAEIASTVESNPLLDWVDAGEPLQSRDSASETTRADAPDHDGSTNGNSDHAGNGDTITQSYADTDWTPPLPRSPGFASGDEPTAAEQVADIDSLQDHLLWQLHLSHLSPRDRRIGLALVESIDDDGYLRDALAGIAAALAPEMRVGPDEIESVLLQVQRFDPAGVGARDLGECLRLQLQLLPEDTPGQAVALELADHWLQQLPKLGTEALARELGRDHADVEAGIHLLRGLDPRPGARIGGLPADTYVTPDVVIWHERGLWRVALASGTQPRISIQHDYERMITHATGADASYLRSRLQEAHWLLKSIQARGETLLKVMECVLRHQSAFLEFGAQALRPLTLREVAGEISLHESTVSRAVSRKYAHTPRGTIALRSFFASGVETGAGGEASSTAIQATLQRLIQAENPSKPLSDARLADALKACGVPVARRTVAKYREALGIASSHERMRMR